MIRQSQADEVRLPGDAQPIAAVTILDAEGHILRVVPATEFRRAAKADPQAVGRVWRRGRKAP
jgi:hypothetical protein